MTLHAALQYLRYRWRAQGRHGTHSPFVYGFVEEVVRKRTDTLEERILRYTGASCLTEVNEIEAAISGSVVIVRQPHASAAASARWRSLCARPDVSLSIDLYRIGLLFFRKEFRTKQHFILR